MRRTIKCDLRFWLNSAGGATEANGRLPWPPGMAQIRFAGPLQRGGAARVANPSVHSQRDGEVIHPGLRHHEPLWPAEAAEGRVGGGVRLAHIAMRPDVGDLVRVVAAEECSGKARLRYVHGVPGVEVQLDIDRSQPPIWPGARAVFARKGCRVPESHTSTSRSRSMRTGDAAGERRRPPPTRR